MQLVQSISVGRQCRESGGVKTTRNESGIKRNRYRRIVHTPEQKIEIEKLLTEVRQMYKKCKVVGKASEKEKARYNEIRKELIKLKAI